MGLQSRNWETRDDKLLIISSEGPGHLYGGVGRHVSEILPRLAKRRPTQLICVPSYCLREPPRTPLVRVDPDQKVITLYDPNHVGTLRKNPFELDRYDRAADRLTEAVLPYLPDRMEALLLEDHYDTGLALRLADTLSVSRLVVFTHLPLSARFSYFDKGADEERQQVLEAAALLSADTVLVPSKAAQRTVSSVYPLAPDRVRVAPLGAASIKKEDLDLENRPSRIVTIGRFSEQKGWSTYLSVVEQVELHGFTPVWSLIGEGPLRGIVLERLHDLVPKERIKWVDHLDPLHEMPDELARSAVFFLPSAHETFGLAALEAAAAGAVPILANVGAIPELWGDKAVLFEPGAVDLAATKIELFLKDPPYRIAAARTAWQWARRFDWDTHVELLETFCFDV